MHCQVVNLQGHNWFKGERDNKIKCQCDKSITKCGKCEWGRLWFEGNEWEDYGL